MCVYVCVWGGGLKGPKRETLLLLTVSILTVRGLLLLFSYMCLGCGAQTNEKNYILPRLYYRLLFLRRNSTAQTKEDLL